MRTLRTIIVLLAAFSLTVFSLTACSNSPLSNPASLSQLGNLTNKSEGKTVSTVGVGSSASFEQLQQVSKKVGNVISASAAALNPNSPEALHRAEMISRGELEEDSQTSSNTDANSLHDANSDNCPASKPTTGMSLSTIPMGISECEVIALRGKPNSVRKLSLPNEERRVVLSFKSNEGELLYEFVNNRLATIY